MLTDAFDDKNLLSTDIPNTMYTIRDVTSSASPAPPPDLSDPNIRVLSKPPAIPGLSPRHLYPVPSPDAQAQLTNDTNALFGQEDPNENSPTSEDTQDQSNYNDMPTEQGYTASSNLESPEQSDEHADKVEDSDDKPAVNGNTDQFSTEVEPQEPVVISETNVNQTEDIEQSTEIKCDVQDTAEETTCNIETETDNAS